MAEIDNSKTIKEYQSQISSQIKNLSDEDAASLSTHYNNAAAWTNIATNLINGGSISSFTSALDGYNVTMRADAMTLTETTNSGLKGRVQLPDINGIASNMEAAFNKAGYNVNKADIISKLQAKYGADNDNNNSTLANMNKVVADYLNGSGSVENIYNNLFNNSTLNINNTYPAGTYEFKRKNLGTCTITYGTKEQGTGRYDWKKNEKYYQLVAEYNKLKELENYKFVVVDAKTANSTDFIGNIFGNNLAVLIDFDATKGIKEMENTSVATETSLQEVSNEKELRKAEAKYEADMKRIDLKDRKYDTDLAALDNERNAIKQEMETLKTVAKDNVERTFKLFS